MPVSRGSGRGAEKALLVLPSGPDLAATVTFFTEELGFRIDAVRPADLPRVVEISGFGMQIRLEKEATLPPGVLCLRGDAGTIGKRGELTAPNGTRIRFEIADAPPELPPVQPSFVLTRATDGSGWHVGRAGMEYRDLIPDRQGGRIIASHIRIPAGGPVPDYVHFHGIRFQMIYCVRGWVRVVYEDQGPPFLLQAGDCVLQPPRIRHRVLECSPGLEVIEVSSPAEHETRADHDLALPTPGVDPERDFGGQRFVRHVAADAPWSRWRMKGFRARDTGIAAATGGLASVQVACPEKEGATSEWIVHRGELLFLFVLGGGVELLRDRGIVDRLARGDSLVVPPGMPHSLTACSQDLSLLEIRLPARFDTGPWNPEAED